MPTLLELQRDMEKALLAGDAATPPSTVIGGALTAASRVRIYRNNVLGNLTGALRLMFPAVERLVGADFFAGAAARFITATPPASADLYEYGAAFPAFLAAFEPARGIAYLPDVATLEWAVNHALHATVVPVLTAEVLLGIPDEQRAGLRFAAHPSLPLLALTYPARAVWDAVLTGDVGARASALAAIDITAEGDVLAVLNGSDGLVLLHLSPSAYTLARALAEGQPLADALDLIPPPDAAPVLGSLIAHGFFGRCELPEIPGSPRTGPKR
ncbi:MAG TPA: DNA-binding domain-containing protein [Rhodopila sp.]|nr:DNA-binding domain-containing protein [Rhodopila sp.]